jgi:hypothetical protein
LFHYAALETIHKILEFDDLRLSHAEYSNDQHELVEAKDVIQDRIQNFTGNTRFRRLVMQNFNATATDINAYIFCMSTGLPGVSKPQDTLSRWHTHKTGARRRHQA